MVATPKTKSARASAKGKGASLEDDLARLEARVASSVRAARAARRRTRDRQRAWNRRRRETHTREDARGPDNARLAAEFAALLADPSVKGRALLVAILQRTKAHFVAARCRVTSPAVSQWVTGWRKPGVWARRALDISYGIPADSWDR